MSTESLDQTFTIREVLPGEKDLLRQIFLLRVKCREDSGFVTFEKFPNGWYDEEDAVAKHFVAFDEDKLIASGRVNFYESISEIPAFPAFPEVSLNGGRIGFLYRNGVLPAYRKMGISRMMNDVRENYMREHACRYSMGYCRDFQVDNFLKRGYKNYGVLDTTKITWDLAPDNWHLMIMEL